MKLRVLAIGPYEKQIISELISRSEANPLTHERLKKLVEGGSPPIGDDPNYVCYLTGGFRIVYTVEEQKPGEYFRHISISVDAAGACPNIAAIQMICREFGFQDFVIGGEFPSDISLWTEKEVEAVNVLQPKHD